MAGKRTYLAAMMLFGLTNLVAGCTAMNGGAARVPEPTSSRGANGIGHTPATDGTGLSPKANPSALNVARAMPYPLVWCSVSSDATSKIQTPYGLIQLAPIGISKTPVTVQLVSDGKTSALYRSSTAPFQQIVGWQLHGPYLALRIGLPPSHHPTTGDYAYRDVVMDLRNRWVTLVQPSTIQSTDYLSTPYFVQSVVETVHGVPHSIVRVVRLSTGHHMTLQLPVNAVGLGIVSGGKVFYEMVRGRLHSVDVSPLPSEHWLPANNHNWTPVTIG